MIKIKIVTIAVFPNHMTKSGKSANEGKLCKTSRIGRLIASILLEVETKIVKIIARSKATIYATETLIKLSPKPKKNCFASRIVKPRMIIRSNKKIVKIREIVKTCFLFRSVLILCVYRIYIS